MIFGAARVAPEKAVFRPVLPMSPLPGISEMHVNHGAIETEYKGYRFRSRLEARWAVFFDALGVEWKYEDQGYEVDGHRYLPDFVLPGLSIFCEVKGDPEGLSRDAGRLRHFVGPKSPLPGWIDGSSRLLVLGDVPSISSGQICFHPVISLGKFGAQRAWGTFVPLKGGGVSVVETSNSFVEIIVGLMTAYRIDENADEFIVTGWEVETRHPNDLHCPASLFDAYKKARQARFEHGQSGALPSTSRGR